MANENFRVKNGLEVGGVLVVNSSGALVANISVGTTTVNTTAIGVGSNITINTSSISVGNSTVNAVLTQNSLDIDGTITSGNLNVTGHIMPGANVTYDLGNTTMRWRDLYLSGTTIDIGGALLQTDANSGAIAIIPKPTAFEPNPTATVISPQGGVVAVPTTGGVPAANAITEAAESNTASPVPIDVTTVAPANSQILVWSASANVFLPANTLLYLNALNSVTVGANLIANTSALFIGNSTVNAVLTANSLDIDGTVAVGNTTITGDLTVSGNVFFNGGTTNVNSTNLVVEDKNIILGDTATPTDVTADGGGITLKGTTDKTLTWVDSTDAWTASEDFNLVSGKQYEINGTQVINSTSLGTGITGSSLTSVGTLNGLSVSGTANATTSINVGANVNLSTSTINVGNSTVNTTVTSSVVTTSNVVATNLSGNGASVTSVDAATVGGNTASTLRTYSDTVGATAFSNAATRANDAYTNATAFAANATNISSGTLNTARLPATVNVSTAINVGANVNINTSTIFIGNSTVNTTIQAGNINLQGTQLTVGNITISDSVLSLGNSTVNVFANSTILRVGTNVVANSTALLVGNSTVNTLISSAGIDTDGTLAVLGTSQLTGNTTISGDLVVSGNVFFNGTTTNVNSTNLVVEDKNIIIGDVATPTDVTADGGGITLKGATDKTLNWVDATDAWTSSEDFNLLTGKQYEINGVQVVNSTALGTGVTGSSLTSVGTLTGLTVSGAASLQNTLAAGNTTVTGFANISGNVYVGNSSVFWTANSTEIDVGNVTINTTAVGVGANLIANTTALFIGNSTVNTAIRSTGLSIGSNVTVNATAIQAGNSTANITIGSDTAGPGGNLYLKHSGTSYIYHGNSTVNATIASTQFVLKNNLTSAGATPAGDIDLFFGTADSPRIVLRRNNGDGTQRIPVSIVAGLGAGFDGVSTTDALRATSGTSATTTSLPNSPEFQANATLVYIGNSTVNTQITSTAIDTDGTLSVLGAATLSSTLAAGNTTVTGFVNASVSVNSSLITVGTNLIGNTTGLYHTGTVNAASHTVGASLIGNSSGLYHTGTVNAASHTTTGVTANVTGVYPASNSSGTALGAATNRWILNANTVDASGLATLSGGMNTTTANASVGINVGANVNLTTTNINVGNSTVNTAITSTAIDTDGTLAVLGAATLSSTLAAGNTTITGFANVSGNVYVGNSTVFWTANSTTINVGTTTVNTSRITVATNVVINTSAFFVGNSTVNTIVSAGSLTLNGGTIAVGNTTITGDLIVSGNVFFNGTTTNVNSTNLVVEDKNIVLGDVGTPSDTTADGGGITLKGATDKTLNWVDATDAWTSSEEFNLLTGKSYRINGAVVVNSSSLGTGVTGSSLTSVGTLTGLTVSGATSLQNTLAAGNTTITGFANVSGNVYVGNSTVFWTANSTTINVGTSSVNTTVIAAGANVFANTSTLFVGNSTVNTVITAGNIALNGSQLTIGNSTVTTTMTGDILTVGNSTVNTVVNSTSISAAKLVANGATGTADQLLYANSTGGVYWRTPATITNVEPSNVGATSNGHVWYVYV